MAKLSQCANAQLEDLVFDANIDIELYGQGREYIIKCRQLLRKYDRHFK